MITAVVVSESDPFTKDFFTTVFITKWINLSKIIPELNFSEFWTVCRWRNPIFPQLPHAACINSYMQPWNDRNLCNANASNRTLRGYRIHDMYNIACLASINMWVLNSQGKEWKSIFSHINSLVTKDWALKWPWPFVGPDSQVHWILVSSSSQYGERSLLEFQS